MTIHNLIRNLSSWDMRSYRKSAQRISLFQFTCSSPSEKVGGPSTWLLTIVFTTFFDHVPRASDPSIKKKKKKNLVLDDFRHFDACYPISSSSEQRRSNTWREASGETPGGHREQPSLSSLFTSFYLAPPACYEQGLSVNKRILNSLGSATKVEAPLQGSTIFTERNDSIPSLSIAILLLLDLLDRGLKWPSNFHN